MMNLLDTALGDWFSLAVWGNRYGGHWTALLAPCLDDAGWVEGQLSGGDEGAVEMQSYLSRAGALFPVSLGTPMSPSAAISSLEQKLALVPSNKWQQWRESVRDGFEAMKDAERKYPRANGFIRLAFEARELVVINDLNS